MDTFTSLEHGLCDLCVCVARTITPTAADVLMNKHPHACYTVSCMLIASRGLLVCLVHMARALRRSEQDKLPFMSTAGKPQTVHPLIKSRVLLVSVIATLLASILLARCSVPLRASLPSSILSFRHSSFTSSQNLLSGRAFTKMAYEKEQQVAIAAVLKACDVAQATFQKLVNDETVTKKDKSPVTGEVP